jgi:hypothetical protein
VSTSMRKRGAVGDPEPFRRHPQPFRGGHRGGRLPQDGEANSLGPNPPIE